jgi:hypothetical protein
MRPVQQRIATKPLTTPMGTTGITADRVLRSILPVGSAFSGKAAEPPRSRPVA